MAEPQALPTQPRQSLKPGQAIIVGRVSDVKKTDSAVYTIIQTPAPDAYSHPGNHEVKSSRMIGRPGEDVQITVQLSGFRRSYQNKHGEKVFTVDNSLTAIED